MELTWPLGSRERGPSSESILVPIGRWWVCLPSELLGPGSAHWGVSGHLWLSSVQYCYPLPKPIPLSIWLLVQILLCGLFTLTSGLCWSTDHLGTSASSLGILGVPGAPGHQVWEHPWAYVSGHCPFLLSAPMCGRWGLPDLQPHLAMPLGVGSEPDVPRLPYTTPPFLSSDLRASSYFRFCLTGTPPGHILLFPWSSFHPSSLSGAIITERM